MKKTLSILAVVATTAAVPAFAQMFAPGAGYIGAGIGRGNLNINGTEFTGLNNATVGDTDTSWTVRGGWRFHPYMAVEVGYYEFGTYDFRGTAGPITVTGDAKVESYSLSLVGILPLGEQFEGYGRIGYAHTKAKFSANAAIASAFAADTQEEATYGIGARWHFTRNWSLFAEWMKNDKIKIDNYLAGIDLRF
jgi:OmpA-OmpF porin, OOP family